MKMILNSKFSVCKQNLVAVQPGSFMYVLLMAACFHVTMAKLRNCDRD